MRAATTLLLLALCACQGTPPAKYQETRTAGPRSEAVHPTETPDPFGTYSDAVADKWLTDQVASAIEERMREDRARAAARRESAPRETVRIIERYYRGHRYRRRHALEYVPWGTMFYGGLGAALGRNSRERRRGFAIGAGIGLLHDMLRWRW